MLNRHCDHPHTDYSILEELMLNKLFLLLCSQGSTYRHLNRKRQNTTHWLQFPQELKSWRVTILSSFAFSLPVSVSTHWKTNNLSTTYWETSLDGLSAQEFQLFLHYGLLTRMHIHTLRWKDEDLHILSHIAWWVQCATGTGVSGLSWIDNYVRPHSHRQTKTPSHTDNCRLM